METQKTLISQFLRGWTPKERTFETINICGPSRMIRSRSRLDNILSIWDPEASVNRELRFATNQKSPFIDEQKDPVMLSPIIFSGNEAERNTIVVPMQNVVLQQFLILHPDNEANGGNIFRELNPQKQAEDQEKQFEQKAEAFTIISQSNFDVLEAISYELIGESTFDKTTTEVKRDLFVIAESTPHLIINSSEDTLTKHRYIAKKASKFGVIKFVDEGRTVVWGDNDKKITAVPVDKTPVEFMGEYFITDEGIALLSKIETKLKKFD